MIIKVCDRCGATIESGRKGIHDQMTQAIPKIHYQIKKYYGVGVPGIVTEISDEIHLCENCNNDLTAWLGIIKMSGTISRQAAIGAICSACGKIDCDQMDTCEKLKLPSVQQEPCDDPRADVYYLAEKIGIHQLYALVVELRGEPELISDEQKNDGWTPCSERLPDCEQEVLICTEKKLVGQTAYIDTIVTPAIYEDGTMPECDSKWSWIDMDFDEWDEENDCGIVPEGWWENRHFNRDEEYNNPVDQKVVAWMPLPGPWEGERE